MYSSKSTFKHLILQRPFSNNPYRTNLSYVVVYSMMILHRPSKHNKKHSCHVKTFIRVRKARGLSWIYIVSSMMKCRGGGKYIFKACAHSINIGNNYWLSWLTYMFGLKRPELHQTARRVRQYNSALS